MRINEAKSPDIKVMGLFYFRLSPTKHPITDVFEGIMSKAGPVKIIYKLNNIKVILTFAFITGDLYWHWSSV